MDTEKGCEDKGCPLGTWRGRGRMPLPLPARSGASVFARPSSRGRVTFYCVTRAFPTSPTLVPTLIVYNACSYEVDLTITSALPRAEDAYFPNDVSCLAFGVTSTRASASTSVRQPEHPSPYMLVSTTMLASRTTSRIEWRIVLVGRSFAERLSQCHYRHGTSVSR